MRHDVSETDDSFQLGLLRRAREYGDLQAWATFQQDLEETVLAWFHHHPQRAAASSLQGESHFVTQAFEQFWHIIIQQQGRCETLREALVCLHVCLNGAIQETLRVARRKAVCGHESVEQAPQEDAHSPQVWEWVQGTLSNEHERRLAYLLYHCGLKPAEIVRDCSQEWSDVHEVTHLRHVILASLSQSGKDLC